MSAEMRTISVGVTVLDSEHLPEGITQEKAFGEVEEVIQDAVHKWYVYQRATGRDRLACEPTVG